MHARLVSLTAHWIRVRHSKGESIADLAARYGMVETEVFRHLEGRRLPRRSRALPPAVLEVRATARAAARATARAKARAFRWLGDDWRFKDDIGPSLEAPTPPAVDQVDQLPAEIPAVMLGPRPLEPWGGPVSPHASSGPRAPRRITAEVLAQVLELRAAGMSWPEIARQLGVSRMGLYYAIRR